MKLSWMMHEGFNGHQDILEIMRDSFDELVKNIEREEELFIHLLFGNDDPGVEILASVLEERGNVDCANKVRKRLKDYPGMVVIEKYGDRVASVTVKIKTSRGDGGKDDFPVDILISMLATAFEFTGLVKMEPGKMTSFKNGTLAKCFEKRGSLPCAGVIDLETGLYSKVLSREKLMKTPPEKLRLYFHDILSGGGLVIFSDDPGCVEKFCRVTGFPPKRTPCISLEDKKLLKQLKNAGFNFEMDDTIGIMIEKGDDDDKDTITFISKKSFSGGLEELSSLLVNLCKTWMHDEGMTSSYFF